MTYMLLENCRTTSTTEIQKGGCLPDERNVTIEGVGGVFALLYVIRMLPSRVH